MKEYHVRNLRNGEVAIYHDLDRAESFIKISVMFNNERKKLTEKRWTKKDFDIIEIDII